MCHMFNTYCISIAWEGYKVNGQIVTDRYIKHIFLRDSKFLANKMRNIMVENMILWNDAK